MAESEGSKPTISLGELATRLLVFLTFLQVFIPHLKALCITMRDKPWVDSGPTVVDVTPKAASNVA